MKFTTRQLVTIAVFGSIWGLIEVSFGSVVKSLHIPFGGVVLTAIGIMILLIGRTFVPKMGTIVMIGLVAMMLKLFSIGHIIIGPMFGILVESILVEIVLLVFHQQNRLVNCVAGSISILWTLIHPLVTGLLFFGREPLEVWSKTLASGAEILGIPSHAIIWIALVLVSIHAIMGFLAALALLGYQPAASFAAGIECQFIIAV